MPGATATYAFPYPVVGDSPHGPSQIQALAQAVEDKIELVDAAISGNTQGKILGRGRRTTLHTSTTSIVGVLRLAAVSVTNGRSYRIVATFAPRSTIAGDRILTEIRYTTDGSTTPTTSSTVMVGGQHYQTASGISTADTHVIDTQYEPGANQSLWMLLCVSRATGTGSVQLYADSTAAIDIAVYDNGVAVGNTGTSV